MQACILFTASPSSESTVKNIRQLCREFGLEPGKTLSDGTSSCLAQEAHSTARIEFSALREAAASYQIDVAGKLCTARASLKPLYDPTGEKMKG